MGTFLISFFATKRVIIRIKGGFDVVKKSKYTFKRTAVDSDKVKVGLQKTVRLHNISWRIGSSRTVFKSEVKLAEESLIKYIEDHFDYTLHQLMDLYPTQYERALKSVDKLDVRKDSSSSIGLLTYGKAVDIYRWGMLKEETLAEGTIYNRYRAIINPIESMGLSEVDIRTFTPNVVQLLIDEHYKKGFKPKHASRHAKYWGLFFKWLVNNRYLDTHPLIGHEFKYKAYKSDSGESRVTYSRRQLDLLYEALGEVEEYRRPRARILQLMMDTGLRPGEAAVLKYEDLVGAYFKGTTIDKSSTLWDDLTNHYHRLLSQPLYREVMKLVKTRDDINIPTLSQVFKDAEELSTYNRQRLMNTIRFIHHYPSVSNYQDFGFVIQSNRKAKSSYDNPSSTLSDFFNSNGNLGWFADVLDGFDSSIIISRTQQTQLAEDGKTSVIGVKEAAKTNSGTNRSVPLNQRSRDTLTRHFRELVSNNQAFEVSRKTGYIFIDLEYNRFVDSRNLEYVLRVAVKELGKKGHDIPYLSPHNLRHSYATIIASDIDDRVAYFKLMEILGHNSLQTTLDAYVHGRHHAKDKTKSDLKF